MRESGVGDVVWRTRPVGGLGVLAMVLSLAMSGADCGVG